MSTCNDIADGILGAHANVAIVTFCESCGDRVPGLPHPYDGGALDLATTYVQTTPDRYDNLAELAGCSAGGNAPSLRIEHDHGDLIVPERLPGKPVVVVQAAVPHDELAIGGSVAGTLILVIAVRALRHRRAHRPRL